MTSINGYCERRPGFANYIEPTPTTFIDLQRIFAWDDLNGNFYVMFSDVDTVHSLSKVYKFTVGVDTSAVLIYTDNTSSVPYDYVVSNGIVYFGNGVFMKKWVPSVNQVWNWGIAIGSVNDIVGPNFAGAGSNNPDVGNIPWSNPGNVGSGVSYASAAMSGSVTDSTNHLIASTFGFAISSTSTVNGMIVDFAYQKTLGTAYTLLVQLGKNGALVGSPKSIDMTGLQVGTYAVGGTADLWGGSFTPNDVNTTITVNFFLYTPNPTTADTINIGACSIEVFGTGGPSVALTTGSLTASVGYEYVFCYGNSVTGGLSSPTPASSSIKPTSQGIQVSLTKSLDPQVNQIHVFRTTDSAGPGVIGGTFFEIPTSPYANATANIVDNAVDTSLNISSIAPTPGFNDPPPPANGFVYSPSGRIYMKTGNYVWFTGLEEITNGVPEECVPSGVAGNFWKQDQTVEGIGLAGTGQNSTVGIFCGGRLYGITGTTLDTFQRFTVSNRRGTRQEATVTELGGMCAWLDSSNQIWATDGSSLQELSIPIRPDLTSVDPENCSMTFHTAGRFHWLVFSTGSELFVYDVDTEQWMPPWIFSADYVFSGETSPGNYVLMASTGTKAVYLIDGDHNDQGNPYQPEITTNLFSLVPDFGRRFSYIATGSYDEPSRTGLGWYYQVDTNGKTTLSDVLTMTDDDPTQAPYTSILQYATTVEKAFSRSNGKFLVQNVYSNTLPAARWVSMRIKLIKADQQDNIYGWYVAYKPVGGR